MRSFFTTQQVYQNPGHSEKSDVSTVVQYLLNNKVRHSLICIICDDFVDTIPGLAALAQLNDVVFFHCFDEYETTLESEKKHGLLGAGKKSRTVWFSH